MESIIILVLCIAGCLNIRLTQKSLAKICDEIKKEYPQKLYFDFLVKTIIEKYTRKQNRRTGFALLFCFISFFVFLFWSEATGNQLLMNITGIISVASAMGMLTCLVRFVATDFYSTRNRILIKLKKLPDEWIADLLTKEETIYQANPNYHKPELTPAQKKESEIAKKETFFPTVLFDFTNSPRLTKYDMLDLITKHYQKQSSFSLFFAIPFSLGGLLSLIVTGFSVFFIASLVFFIIGFVAFILFFRFKYKQKKLLKSISLEKISVEKITDFEKYEMPDEEGRSYYICTDKVKLYVSESDYEKITAKNGFSKSDEFLFVHMNNDIPLVICLSNITVADIND